MIVQEILEKLRKCDDFHNRCDYLMEHDEITYLLEYINNLNQKVKDIIDCINYYAVEDEDFSKIYNIEETELMKILNKFYLYKGEPIYEISQW